MKARTLVWMFWGLMLGGSVTAAGGQQWLDPGDGSGTAVTRAFAARYSMELVLEAGAQAPLRPLPSACQLEVRQGEVLLTVGRAARDRPVRRDARGPRGGGLHAAQSRRRRRPGDDVVLPGPAGCPETYPAQTLA